MNLNVQLTVRIVTVVPIVRGQQPASAMV